MGRSYIKHTLIDFIKSGRDVMINYPKTALYGLILILGLRMALPFLVLGISYYSVKKLDSTIKVF